MKYYFECDCNMNEHMFCVTSEDSEDQFPPELYFHFQMSQYRGVLSRIWTGIKYVFGYKSKYGHWDTISISKDNLERLLILLHQHRVKLEKFAQGKSTYDRTAN